MRILVEAFCWLMQHQHHPWEDNFTSTTLTFPLSLSLCSDANGDWSDDILAAQAMANGFEPQKSAS